MGKRARSGAEHRFEDDRSSLAGIEARRAEADHRIANSLQIVAAILKRESRRITSVEHASGAIQDAALRLMAVARVHRQLSRDAPDGMVDLGEFLGRLQDDVAQSIGVQLDIDAAHVRLPGDVAAQFCIVVNEIAMNAVKHGAQDGRPVVLRITVRRTGEGSLRLTLRDNGPGLPSGFRLDGGGLGMTIVTATVDRLGGRLDVLPGPGAGFAITLPAGRLDGTLTNGEDRD